MKAENPYKIGDIVPYFNTHGNIKDAKITEFKEVDRNGKLWFYGIDTVTKASVYYPVHGSQSIRVYVEAELSKTNAGLLEKIEQLKVERDEANNLLREIAMRNQLTFPANEQDLEWFDNAMNAQAGVKLMEYLERVFPETN